MNTFAAHETRAVSHILHPMTNPIAVKRDGVAVVEHAQGIRMTIDGREYLDMLSGLGCVNVGYGNKEICDAAHEAMLAMSYAHGFSGQSNRYAVSLARKLAELTNRDFPQFFFASTGSDANESAAKIVLRYWRLKGEPERRVFLSREHSYHGNAVFTTSLTGIDHYHTQFGLPMKEWVRHFKTAYPYRDGCSPESASAQSVQAFEDTILSVGAHRIAALYVEPIQATGGMLMPPDGYLQGLKAVCEKYGILLIADEVVTGFGKTGSMFAYQHFDFKPDLLVMAKGLTSTYFPMSAIGLGKKVLDLMNAADEDFEHGFTNCGHPVGSATALANIKVIEERGLVEHVNSVLAPIMRKRLAELEGYASVGNTRSTGVMGGIEFRGTSKSDGIAFCRKVGAEIYTRGVIARPIGAVVHVVAPLITTANELEGVFDTIASSIVAVAAAEDESVHA